MPTLMVTETTETTYYNDGSAKQETYLETDTFKNKDAFESEDETVTIYNSDLSNDEVEILMFEADTEFYEQEMEEMAEA